MGGDDPMVPKKKKYECPIEDFRMTGERVKVRFPQVRHPGDFQAVFSLPLNASITPFSSPRRLSIF